MNTAALIYNPIAGHHPQKRLRQMQGVVEALKAHNIEARLTPTSAPGTAGELARNAILAGDELILACGGDGTINEVINGMALSRATLGILPGGTANIAAKELRLPHDPLRAASELARWSRCRIAVGRASWNVPGASGGPRPRVEQRYFLSVAGVGFDAYIVRRLALGLKRSVAVAAYVLEALRQVYRYSFPRFSCSVEGREVQATFAVIQRTRRYAGWLHLAPTGDLFIPRFSLCLFQSPRRARYFLYAAAVFARQHLRLHDVEFVEASKAACTPTDPDATIHFELDGELVGQLPATFEVIPDALTLLVP